MGRSAPPSLPSGDGWCESLGLIGLGTIGLAIAERLLSVGHQVVGFDVDAGAAEALAAAGGEAAASPSEVAARARTVLITVPDTSHILDSLEGQSGLARGLRRGSRLVVMSTVDPSTPIELSRRLETEGVTVVDAALSGGPELARAGRLALMVGGDGEDVSELRPVLESLAAKLVHVGPLGHGEVAKLAHNLVGTIIAVGLAEGLALASKAGADTERVAEAIGAGTAANRILSEWLPRTVFANDYEARFSLDLMRKDVGLIRDAAAELGIEVPILELGADLLDRASAAGHGGEDFSVIVDLRAREVGAPLRHSAATDG